MNLNNRTSNLFISFVLPFILVFGCAAANEEHRVAIHDLLVLHVKLTKVGKPVELPSELNPNLNKIGKLKSFPLEFKVKDHLFLRQSSLNVDSVYYSETWRVWRNYTVGLKGPDVEFNYKVNDECIFICTTSMFTSDLVYVGELKSDEFNALKLLDSEKLRTLEEYLFLARQVEIRQKNDVK